jgi:hypothetical protein
MTFAASSHSVTDATQTIAIFARCAALGGALMRGNTHVLARRCRR